MESQKEHCSWMVPLLMQTAYYSQVSRMLANAICFTPSLIFVVTSFEIRKAVGIAV